MEDAAAAGMREIPVFPLGSALLPSMPAVLRVFEERFLVLLTDVLASTPPEFGVVLIERGAEVGGGDRRFPVGAIATITQLMQGEGFVGLMATGGERFEVEQWRDDAPYPRALVRPLPALEWDESLRELLDGTAAVVKRALARSSEYTEQRWSADTELGDDPVAAAWQLAGIAPIEELDRLTLLRSASVEELLTTTVQLTDDALELLVLRAVEEDDFDEDDDDPRTPGMD